VILTQDPNLGPGGTPYPPARWGAALTTEIRSLSVPASRVIVLGNIPQTPKSGPGCLSQNPHDVQACSAQNSPYIVVTSAAERQAAATTGARYIDVDPLFCSTICTGVVGNYQPYWDPYHVTATYSYVVGEALDELLDLPAYATPTSTSTTTAPTSVPYTAPTG